MASAKAVAFRLFDFASYRRIIEQIERILNMPVTGPGFCVCSGDNHH
jgi:hypothetical protein